VNITGVTRRAATCRRPRALASLTKGGSLRSHVRSRVELAKCGCAVNAVSPGVIKTPMHAPASHDFLAKLHPIGRMGEPRTS